MKQEMYSPQHKEVLDLMKGAYDLHMHPLPDVGPRSLSDFEAMELADRYGMAGILIKNHMDPTPARAWLMNVSGKYKATAYSGAVLNLSVGGLNPIAVKTYLKMGAKVIWMPTVHARNHVEYTGSHEIPLEKSIRILDENDNLKPEVIEILDLIAENNAVLATGHISMGESIAVCKAARERNIHTVLTHPDWGGTLIPLDIQKKLAAEGVFIEKLWFDVGLNLISSQYMADTMRELGFEHCFLSTDRGQPGKEYPVEGLMMFMDALLDCGLTKDELFIMTHTVPASLISGAEVK